jgi:hypothetical protein
MNTYAYKREASNFNNYVSELLDYMDRLRGELTISLQDDITGRSNLDSLDNLKGPLLAACTQVSNNRASMDLQFRISDLATNINKAFEYDPVIGSMLIRIINSIENLWRFSEEPDEDEEGEDDEIS